MGTIIATINLKGGVAKTTTTVGLAEILSEAYNKKVLVIDLDPQTNATTMLIGEDKWKQLNNNEFTIARIFKDALSDDTNVRSVDINDLLQRNVSNVADVRSVDLLASSLDLIDVQDKLSFISCGKFYSKNPTDILKKAVKPILDNYDYVLIDCPPNLGIITLNGLKIADGYIIPTIPDVLSTYGIPQIIKRVKEFSEDIGEEIEPLGIVVTKYRAASSLHNRTLNALKKGKDAQVFRTIFPENTKMAEAAEYINVNTLRQKWGYEGQYNKFYELAGDIIARTSR